MLALERVLSHGPAGTSDELLRAGVGGRGHIRPVRREALSPDYLNENRVPGQQSDLTDFLALGLSRGLGTIRYEIKSSLGKKTQHRYEVRSSILRIGSLYGDTQPASWGFVGSCRGNTHLPRQ